jgi:hypothetical protein
MRSSEHRNKRCPMCNAEPDVVEAPDGSYGDGFVV